MTGCELPPVAMVPLRSVIVTRCAPVRTGAARSCASVSPGVPANSMLAAPGAEMADDVVSFYQAVAPSWAGLPVLTLM